jgi:hypothetical protein
MSATILSQQLALPALSDPDNVQEVFCNNVIVQVRQGGVQMVFCSLQAAAVDASGQTVDRLVVRSRVGMPAQVAIQTVTILQQLGTAIQFDGVLAANEGEKPN